MEQKLVKLFTGFCGLDWKVSWWDRGVCWLHFCLYLPLTYAHTGKEHNEMITKAHFLSQLKGKISRFPQQISSNEWFIICLKHGSSWMWSLWPPLVGLINHIITYTSGDWSSWTAAWRSLWSEPLFSEPCVQSGEEFNEKSFKILVSRLPCLPSRLASRLPGVYLWHKGSTPLMLGACQHNHHELLHLCELSKNKRSRCNSLGAFSVNRHPRRSGFFPIVLLEHRRVQKLCQCSQNLSLTRSRQCEVCLRALTAFSFWEDLDDHRGDRMLECCAIQHAEINQHWSKNRYFLSYFGFFFFSLFVCVNNKKWVAQV